LEHTVTNIEEARRGDGDYSGYWWWLSDGAERFVPASIEASIRADVDADVRALVLAARAVNGLDFHSDRCPAAFVADKRCYCGMPNLRAALAKFEEVQ
jgi:hypothetical protein